MISLKRIISAVLIGGSLLITPAAQAAAFREPVEVKLSGTGITLETDSADPLQPAMYELDGKKGIYVRDASGKFVRQARFAEAEVAPGGARTAAIVSGRDRELVVIDRANGRTVRMATVAKPFTTCCVSWARDGRRVLLTVEKKGRTAGFVIVDVVRKKTRFVVVPGVAKDEGFSWSADGRSVVSTRGDGIRFYRLNGQVQRTLPKIGWRAGGYDIFSPSGKRVTTFCPPGASGDICVWDVSAAKPRKVAVLRRTWAYGWWDEKHLLVEMPADNGYQTAVVSLNGEITRILATYSEKWSDEVFMTFFRG